MSKQVTRGHNIVVDGWAGAYNPQSLPNSPSGLNTLLHTHKHVEMGISSTFELCVTDPLTDGPMD